MEECDHVSKGVQRATYVCVWRLCTVQLDLYTLGHRNRGSNTKKRNKPRIKVDNQQS